MAGSQLHRYSWVANCTSTGMSSSPEEYGPRRVFDGQGRGSILALALRGGWSRVGDGLIGLVADVQPPTATAGLCWGLHRAVLRRQAHLGFHSSAFLFPWQSQYGSCLVQSRGKRAKPTFSSSSSSSLSKPCSMECPQW